MQILNLFLLPSEKFYVSILHYSLNHCAVYIIIIIIIIIIIVIIIIIIIINIIIIILK